MAFEDKTDAELQKMSQDIIKTLKDRKASEIDKIPSRFISALKKRINTFSKQLSFGTTKSFTVSGDVLCSFWREQKGVGICEIYINDWEALEDKALDQVEASPEFIKIKTKLSKEADSINDRIHELADKYEVDYDLVLREVDDGGFLSP